MVRQNRGHGCLQASPLLLQQCIAEFARVVVASHPRAGLTRSRLGRAVTPPLRQAVALWQLATARLLLSGCELDICPKNGAFRAGHTACIRGAMPNVALAPDRSLPLLVQELTTLSSFEALEREWRTLEQHSGVPFTSWDWAFAWWTELREDKLGVKDSLSLRTVRTGEGQLVAVAPMLITRRPSMGPLCVRQLQFFGADPNITELRGLVAAPEWHSQAYAALVADALRHTDGWDSLLLSGVPADFELGALSQSPEFQWLGETTQFELCVPNSWETFRSGLPRNIKESLRKCYNSLRRDELPFRLTIAERVSELESALERFFKLHAARSQVTDTVTHRDVFETPEARRFLNEVCRRFAERGCLRIFQLQVGDRVVAVRIGFIVGSTLYLYYSGYDLEFAKYSVMTTTVAEAIKYAIENGFERVHLSTGRDVSKTRWNPFERTVRQALLVSPTMRAKLTHHMYRHALSAIETMPALRRATTFLARRTPPPAPLVRL